MTETKVIFASDPDMQGRILVSIHAPDRDAAQAEIDHAMDAAEEDCCDARFFGPLRVNNGYVAFGEIIEP